MKLGSFALVLHSHIPYVRKAGRWPHGEEMLHEVMAETYIPLLNALNELESDGLAPRLTLDLSPVLLEQLADPEVLDHFEVYLEERLALAEAEIAMHDRKNEVPLSYLARWYRDWYANILSAFRVRYQRDLIGGFRRLAETGCLDILTSAATHGYLPLFDRDSTIYAQLKTGVETTRRLLGQNPRGIWLPECGYRPAYMADHHPRPGLEEFLAELNIGYCFTDSPVLLSSRSTPAQNNLMPAATSRMLPLSTPVRSIAVGLPERKYIVRADDRAEARTRTTMDPYYLRASNVAVYGRDVRTGQQVWSAAEGYPGDFVYREFHRKDENSGLQYWRITASNAELAQKEYYDPYPAFQKVRLHAEHFVDSVTQVVRAHYYTKKRGGIVISAYDTELFGHWWFEGVGWLKQTLALLAGNPDVELTTASAYLEANPPEQTVSLPESSWGANNDHSTWLNAETAWMWSLVHTAERAMEALSARGGHTEAAFEDILNQAARELLLLESSDWPFLVTTGQAKEYACLRFQQHLARFQRLATMAQQSALSESDHRFLESVSNLDNPFPQLDYRLFAAR